MENVEGGDRKSGNREEMGALVSGVDRRVRVVQCVSAGVKENMNENMNENKNNSRTSKS